jgi:hypothetical protein
VIHWKSANYLLPASLWFLCLAYSSTLKMEATCYSKTLVGFQLAARYYIPEDRSFHNHSCDNLKSCKLMRLTNLLSCGMSTKVRFTCRRFFSGNSLKLSSSSRWFASTASPPCTPQRRLASASTEGTSRLISTSLLTVSASADGAEARVGPQWRHAPGTQRSLVQLADFVLWSANSTLATGLLFRTATTNR